MEGILYAALAENVKENRSTLLWALHNSGGKKICIIHVHQPAQMIPVLGTRWPASSLDEKEVRAYREIQRQNMNKTLLEYLSICHQIGARADAVYTEMGCVEKGIVELISQHGIKELVMGAAAGKRYAKKLTDLKSKKAIYVCLQAPPSCEIKFICKGHLINTREGILKGSNPEVRSSLLQASQDTETAPLTNSRLSSVGKDDEIIPINSDQDSFSRGSFRGSRRKFSTLNCTEELLTQWSTLDVAGSSEECGRLSRRNPQGSGPSHRMLDIDMIPSLRIKTVENELEIRLLSDSKENLRQPSPLSVLDRKTDDTPYAQLEQALVEAQNARSEAFQEAARRGKAEKLATNALRRAKMSESLYAKESKQRKEIEKTLAKEKEKLERMKKQQDEITEELRTTMDQKLLLDNQMVESDKLVEDLEQRISSVLELMQKCKMESNELKVERDNAQKEAQELRSKQEEASSTQKPHFLSEFSYSEIKEATQNFNPSLKIGEGRYRSIYKGLLRHIPVAIKMLHHHSLQEPLGFQREVDIFSKLRHPNLVTLFGTCQEACALIYEYLPKGSLEDRLKCKDKTPPLPWQTRIRIATEVCSVLVFIHSSKPTGIVHGDLSPSSILLDANFCSKLSEFGICHLQPRDRSSKKTASGTFAYMDPEFLSTAELTPESDVYSFGIILLQLLTGRPALRITKHVQHALDAGNLKLLLDPLAGDCPVEQAEQLAYLALRCCAPKSKNRPDLGSEVLTVLETIKASCGGSSLILQGSEEHPAPPPYLVCPISKQVMLDPHLAADGYTYEAEAFRKWLESGHDTSPMTNLKLGHRNLVPNHALRSAIEEWRRKY